ncbi:MAG: four helix bundle suffix domain-containing protein [Verrucomicrobiota bacterium]
MIHQANYLLDQQISALERGFVEEGGYSERLAAARIAERQKQHPCPAATLPAAPACPRCGKPMALRTARKGAYAGSQFWGCSNYPECRGVRGLEG